MPYHTVDKKVCLEFSSNRELDWPTLVIDIQQILPLLAKEIYSTPLAFLRENVQNAFDAIRLQRHREKVTSVPQSKHRIDIVITGSEVSIKDTGIGMTADDMRKFYWSLGETGKGTQEAKDAGVVGTFGIGGMANFGVANELQLISRTDNNSPAIASVAHRDKLSTQEDCIFYSEDTTPGKPAYELQLLTCSVYFLMFG